MLWGMSPRRISLGLITLSAITCACGDDNPQKPPGPGSLSFALQPTIPVGSTLWKSIASGDFNHDGNADLATASSESALVYVVLGHGDGTFETPRRVSVSENGVTAGDFDHDGNLDLATSRLDIAFLYGHGDGTFDVTLLGVHYLDQFTSSVGDFNGDGIDDYVGQYEDSVIVVLGNSSRAHTRIVSYLPTRVDPYGEGVATDIDGNGHVDYATGNLGSSNHANVYYGNGDGTFQPRATPPDSGWDMGVCSISRPGGGPGRDLAIAHNIGDKVGVLRWVGGTFAGEVTYPTGTSLTDVGSGDFNLDGREDLVVCGLDTNSIQILRGRTDGTFDGGKPFNVGAEAQSLAVVDVNNDGRLDICVAGFRNMYVLLNTSQ